MPASSENPSPHRILLIESRPLVAAGLRSVFRDEDDLALTDIARTSRQGLACARSREADAIVLAADMPDGCGFSTLCGIQALRLEIPVLVLLSRSSSGLHQRYREAGAQRLLPLDTPIDQIMDALRSILKARLSPASVSAPSKDRSTRPSRSRPRRSVLSGQERKVLQRLATGESIPTIADHLGLSPSTVRTYLRRARQKLGAPTTERLTQWAMSVLR